MDEVSTKGIICIGRETTILELFVISTITMVLETETQEAVVQKTAAELEMATALETAAAWEMAVAMETAVALETAVKEMEVACQTFAALVIWSCINIFVCRQKRLDKKLIIREHHDG